MKRRNFMAALAVAGVAATLPAKAARDLVVDVVRIPFWYFTHRKSPRTKDYAYIVSAAGGDPAWRDRRTQKEILEELRRENPDYRVFAKAVSRPGDATIYLGFADAGTMLAYFRDWITLGLHGTFRVVEDLDARRGSVMVLGWTGGDTVAVGVRG